MAYTREGAFETDANGSVIGVPSFPRIVGDRPLDAKSDADGSVAFAVRSGQRYANFQAQDFGNGFLKVGGVVDGLVAENITASNGYRFLEMSSSAVLTNFVLRRIKAFGLERALARFWTASNGLIEDVDVDLGGTLFSGDSFHEGIHFEGACSDITVRNAVLRNAVTSYTSGYPNGDGIASEGASSRLRFENVRVENCIDGGLDIKGREHRIESCELIGNGRNLRCWSPDLSAGTVVSRRPRSAHVSLHGGSWDGERTRVTIDRLVVESIDPNVPLILFDGKGPCHVVIRSWEIIGTLPAGQYWGSKSGASGNTVDWGPQGAPPGTRFDSN